MKTPYKNPLAQAAAIALVILSCLFSYGQTIDPGFKSPEVFRPASTIAMAKGPGKKTYIAGDIDFHGSTRARQLVRVNSDGSLDPTFTADLPDQRRAHFAALEVLPNGNVVVFVLSEVTGTPRLHVLNKYGAKVAETGNVYYPRCARALPDNTFLVGSDMAVTRYNQNGELMGVFINLVYNDDIGIEPVVNDIEVEGSKIIIGGHFNEVLDPVTNTPVVRKNVARFNLDGTLDDAFDASAATQTYGYVAGICVQPDQKVILEKRYRTFSSASVFSMRLNADGSADTQFNSNYPSTLTIDEAHYHNGKITVANKGKIVQLNLDGTLDTSFKPVVFAPARPTLSVLSDDFVVTANYPNALYGITKISPIGVPSITYKAELLRRGIINSMDRTSTSIYIGGDFIKINDHFTRNVARLTLSGSVLTKFRVDFDPGIVAQVDGFENAKALIGNSTTLMRLKHDGSFDSAFNFTPFGGLTHVTKFITQDDGRILIGAPSKIFRIHANGSQDNSFNAAIGGLTVGSYFDFDLDRSTGKIIFGGSYAGEPSPATRNITRLNPDGTIDSSFNSALTFSESTYVQQVMFLDNLEVIVLSRYGPQGKKLLADGSIDEVFSNTRGRLNYTDHDNMVRFGDRIILSSFEFYSQSLVTDTFFEDGETDTVFSVPVDLKQLSGMYADNDHELFVMGDISYAGRLKQIVKVLYEPSDATAAVDQSSVLSFYPNPARNFISINDADDAVVNIYNLTGESKIKAKVTSAENQIDIGRLPAGHYVIQISKGGRSYKHHLIKK